MVSSLDSAITASSFSDEDIAELFTDAAEINALIQVERELARVQEALQIIPNGVGKKIHESLAGVEVEPSSLASGFLQDGIPIPALLKILRGQIEPDAASYLHFGATSHDILDTALIIRSKSAIKIIEENLNTLVSKLSDLARNHIATVMIGRTRNQNAAPIVFGFKVVNWLAPLQRQQQRLNELSTRLLVVQLGGAVGTNAALDSKGTELNTSLAAALGLSPSTSPWHAQRDCIVEFTNWLNLTAGLIGKMAQDLLLMAQSEVGEISFGGTGKSSTMPNKSNPVIAETLISLGNYCRSQADLMAQTLMPAHERDGVSMATERLAFTPLICATGASIKHAINCLSSLNVNEEAMHKNLIADNGRILAEAAVFELCRLMERSQAAEYVAQACSESLTNNSHMIDELEKISAVELDWEALKQPENYLGSAKEIINKIVGNID
ncbi:MAG: hypothetical protein GKR91_07010 [Pseudomonadales bacterium]|nr:hypothetical protein [Pseudomonadales bacterium]